MNEKIDVEICDKILPDELWEEIFKNLNVFELIRLRTVSKAWHDVVNRVIKRTCKWYEKCLQDIPKDHWTSILEHQAHPDSFYDDYHKSKIKMHSHIWSSMYKSWRGWKNLMKKTPRIRTIEIFPNTPDVNDRARQISLSASGNIIAIFTGSYRVDGHLTVYDISEISEEPIFKHVCSGVGEAQVCRKGNDVTVVSSTCVGKVQFWDVRSKKIIHEYKDLPNREIGASLGYCYVWIPNGDQVQSPGTEELTWNMERLSCGIDLRIVRQKRRFEDELVLTMVADADKVRMLLGTSDFTSMKVYEVSEGSKKLKQLSENHMDLLGDGYYYMNMCKPCVLLSADSEEDGMIRASVAGREWKICKIDCFRRDGCNWDRVTALVYHAGLLILGSSSGEIGIIRVENVNDLETFNWDEMEYTVVRLGEDNSPDYDRVEHLAVTEWNSVQYIIAVANDKLHIIEFH